VNVLATTYVIPAKAGIQKTRMPTFRENAVVLRTKSLRDADRHYILFTESRGKMTVLAKGSRKGKSKMAPHLASFGIVDVMVAKGRVIDRLAGASLVRPYKNLMRSLPRTALAQSFLLAVDTLTKRDLPDERTFRIINEFLEAVDIGPEPEDNERSLAFDAGIARLLDTLGFALELRECVRCRAALVPDGNALNVLRGGVECANCREPLATPVSSAAIKAMRFFRTEPVAAVALLRLSPGTLREVGFLTDLLLSSQIEHRFHALRYMKAVG
jgi:DNA repair protein RecO (recombination protein O)